MRPTHTCPGRCGRDDIPGNLFACRNCWLALPAEIRDRIRTNYRSDPAEHLRAMSDAAAWYRDNRRHNTEPDQPGDDASAAAASALTADLTLFARRAGRLYLVVIERGDEPFKGQLALPGGYLNPRERFEAAARREFAEETGLTAPATLYLLGVYDDPDRDPRGRVVSGAYLGYLGEVDRLPAVKGSDDAAVAFWFELDDTRGPVDLVGFAFDHAAIVKDGLAHEVLRLVCQACGRGPQPDDRLIAIPSDKGCRRIHRSHLNDDPTTGLFGACP